MVRSSQGSSALLPGSHHTPTDKHWGKINALEGKCTKVGEKVLYWNYIYEVLTLEVHWSGRRERCRRGAGAVQERRCS